MDLDRQRAIARTFYEENRESLLEAVIEDYHKNLETTVERIAGVRLGELNSLHVEIERINQPVPPSVFDAFARHLWYSHWDLTNLGLVKILIGDQYFFFLFHWGICDDGWDSGDIQLMEIFSEQGGFVGASTYFHEASVKWRETPFSHKDFRGAAGKPTPYPEDNLPDFDNGGPLWTEEQLRREGATVEENGNITRYVWPIP